MFSVSEGLLCLSFLAFATTGFLDSAAAAPKPKVSIVEEGVFVQDPARRFLKDMLAVPELTVDHITREGYEVYGPRGMTKWLSRNNVSFRVEGRDKQFDGYPSPEEIEKQLHQIHAAYPAITEMIRIGSSVKGRGLWVLKISKNAAVDEIEPEFKFISSMHGDEITGRELMVRLAADLVQSYGKDQRITDLINKTEIFIMASMNPDGSAVPKRGNANNVDLNRNFPDFSTSDNQNTIDGREIETQAVMRFQDSRHFALSANFHGGAEVMNYAWDTVKNPHPALDFVKGLAARYASLVPYMKNSTEFPGGITNGYEWYEVDGGMQDWSIYWYNDLQFTIELSKRKWPDYSQIDGYYKANAPALVDFIERIHDGAGIVMDEPNVSGVVEVTRLGAAPVKLGKYQFSNSEFYSVLAPGDYSYSVTTKSGLKREYKVRVGTAASQKRMSLPRYYRVKI